MYCQLNFLTLSPSFFSFFLLLGSVSIVLPFFFSFFFHWFWVFFFFFFWFLSFIFFPFLSSDQLVFIPFAQPRRLSPHLIQLAANTMAKFWAWIFFPPLINLSSSPLPSHANWAPISSNSRWTWRRSFGLEFFIIIIIIFFIYQLVFIPFSQPRRPRPHLIQLVANMTANTTAKFWAWVLFFLFSFFLLLLSFPFHCVNMDEEKSREKQRKTKRKTKGRGRGKKNKRERESQLTLGKWWGPQIVSKILSDGK